MRAWLVSRLRTRRGFLGFATVFIGTLGSLLALFALGPNGEDGAALLVFLVPGAFIGAYWWGVAMWALVIGPLVERQASAK